ncbi:uncharacterized protein LOC143427508 [Xylocopa sonorina]|uniref:uncharacterized protein LOC143427508 n=1 Tax=Xylocopa sonorina TaxID=1818115 RepID=UPI00403AA45F
MGVNKVILLIIYCVQLQLVWSQRTIPESLRECYRDDAMLNSQLPMKLRILMDIIQKLEKYTYSKIDMKTMSSLILQRFKFDGIEYQKNVQATDGILPFSATGTQRIKQKLIEELVPRSLETLPVEILSRAERCMLHRAISNTILTSDNEIQDKPCSQITKTENVTDKIISTNKWDCPQQQGVILTPYGTIAPGAIIGAIAASLQHQIVTVNQLAASPEIPPSVHNFSLYVNSTNSNNSNYNEEEIEFVLPRSQMIYETSMQYNALMTSTAAVDNIWLTTVAGDLAEMVVYQGPLLGNNMTLGATGFWENTLRPIIYYLRDSQEKFDATRAELIGGIDGMIIASYLQTWIQDFSSLRLSQILGMYYSYEGVTFNTNVKACARAQTFLSAIPKTILNEQTYTIAQLLAYRKSIAYISPETMQQMVNIATDKFYTFANSRLSPALPCYEVNEPQVEALVVFDGSIGYTTHFLEILTQDLDVSMYGSKMGIIHGTSGEWLLNVTNSPSLVFQTLNNFTNTSWPTQLNYIRVLETVFAYLNQSWEINQKHHVIGNLGQVVILLTPSGYLSKTEVEPIIKMLRQIKYHHPDVYFIYYVSWYNRELFKSLILSNEDLIIKNSNIKAISQYVSKIPRVLRPALPLGPNSSVSPQLENYITPSKSITYRIHSQWKQNMKKTEVTIHTFGYGAMQACLWIEFKSNKKEDLYCTELAGYKETKLTNNFKCTGASSCPNVYLRIKNVTSLYKCAEIDCKTPDQVRFIIRTNPQSFSYANPIDENVILISLNILILFIFQSLM